MPSPRVESLTGKEVEDIAKCGSVCSIDFGKATSRARNGGEFLVLHVKYLCKSPTGCPKLIRLKIMVLTFFTLPVGVMH